MLRNYVIIAWRNLWRNKFHTTINIFGLAVGVSACLVIYLIVSFELSFNTQHNDYDRIYRIHSHFTGGFSGFNRGVPTPVAPTMREQFTGIQSIVFIQGFRPKVKLPGSQQAFELPTAMALTEPSYFDVFDSYEWIAGSPEVLSRPFEAVLTETSARRYFGSSDPESVIGKQIIYRDSLPVTVSGIVKDLPFNSDINFSDFLGTVTIEQSWLKQSFRLDDWTSTNSSSQAFFKLAPGTDMEHIKAQIPILKKLYEEHSEWDAENNFSLQPLSDIHFNADTGIFDHTSRSPAHLPTLTSLIVVAILLLVIGAINFVNLETAQSLRRSKEVGVRKVLGSSRSTLIAQFLSESLLVTILAIVVALPFTEFALGYFAEFVPDGVEFRLLEMTPVLLGMILIIGVLAGLYPAFVLSSFIPVQALKSQTTSLNRYSNAAFLRKALIVFQFTFAQVLILGTLVVNYQVSFLLNKDLGFKKEAIIYIESPWWENMEKVGVLKNELAQIAEIEDISMSQSPPAYGGWSSSSISFKKEDEEIKLNAFRKFGDSRYIDFYGIQLLAGRNLHDSDTIKEFIINETLCKMLGFQNPEDALGHLIGYGETAMFPIVGVVKDFHIQSLHRSIEPVMLANEERNFSCFNLKLANSAQGTKGFQAGVEKIQAAWKKVYPESTMRYDFLDEALKNFYKTEQRTAKMTNTATGLAILISCLGLFGLVSYTTAQRTKEIGIRKVLGASVENLIFLLSKSFIVLVLIAFILAAPIAWYSAKYWLQGFVYRIELSYLLFGVTALLAIVIAFLTVSVKTFRAAQANPVDSLRNE
jgi:putative ABC transport system permease protein